MPEPATSLVFSVRRISSSPSPTAPAVSDWIAAAMPGTPKIEATRRRPAALPFSGLSSKKNDMGDSISKRVSKTDLILLPRCLKDKIKLVIKMPLYINFCAYPFSSICL